MKNISHYFKRKEFACKCGCGQDTVDYELLLILDMLRLHFQSPVTINSGNRCFNHNHQIGGSPNSQHLKGKAADIKVQDIDPQDVYNYLNGLYMDYYGIGNYKSFTHIDVRSKKARW